MSQLSNEIERFIKALMERECQVELKRNELAQHFGCAPSQINYVLSTRFSVNHGYVTESRRGGGGYIRIVRVEIGPEGNLLGELMERVGSAVSLEAAEAMIAHILDLRLVTRREALIMRSALAVSAMPLPPGAKDVLRAAVLRSMLEQVFRNVNVGMEGGDTV